MACSKNWFFGKPFQSRKWIEIVDNFKAQITCLKNLKFWRTDSVYKKIDFFQLFKARVACMKKEAGTNFVYGTKWKASSSNSVLRKLNFS